MNFTQPLFKIISKAAALLMSGNKYLAHVLVKGIKGDFEPIHNWYQELYSNQKYILQLVVKEESTGSVPLILQALKPGLLSKDEQVVKWACRIYSKLAFDFSNLELLPEAWEWFINEYGGLFASLASLKRHQDIGPNIVAMMTQFARFNMLELFTVEMRKILPSPFEYLTNILQMLRPLTEAKMTKDDVILTSIFAYFISYSF